jgi:hypothetical protein
MEILAILLIIVFAVLFLKIFALIFQTGIFLVMLPFKILAIVLSGLFVFFILIPLGMVGAIVGLLLAPLALIVFFLPVVLIIFGIYLLVKG